LKFYPGDSFGCGPAPSGEFEYFAPMVGSANGAIRMVDQPTSNAFSMENMLRVAFQGYKLLSLGKR